MFTFLAVGVSVPLNSMQNTSSHPNYSYGIQYDGSNFGYSNNQQPQSRMFIPQESRLLNVSNESQLPETYLYGSSNRQISSGGIYFFTF